MQAAAFMGVAKDSTRSAEDVLSTPLPGETLAMFYARSRALSSAPVAPFDQLIYLCTGEYWAQKAYGTSDSRGKQLRRDGFTLAEERYGQCNLHVYIHFSLTSPLFQRSTSPS